MRVVVNIPDRSAPGPLTRAEIERLHLSRAITDRQCPTMGCAAPVTVKTFHWMCSAGHRWNKEDLFYLRYRFETLEMV